MADLQARYDVKMYVKTTYLFKQTYIQLLNHNKSDTQTVAYKWLLMLINFKNLYSQIYNSKIIYLFCIRDLK